MKYQALFSSKDKSKNIKVSSAAILLVALRIKGWIKIIFGREKSIIYPNYSIHNYRFGDNFRR